MNKKLFGLMFFTLCLLSVACKESSKERTDKKIWTVYVSPYKPVICNDDHTSEGFLAPLKNGKILLIFRMDPGIKGDHVGTDGYIAKIEYDPLQDKWGQVQTVYNSHKYDDRNIHGGVTEDGRIVVFFRHYDGGNTEGRYFIYSDDDGKTWSQSQKNPSMSDAEALKMRGNMSTGQMFYNPDIGKYTMTGFLYDWDENRIYTARRRYIAFSDDGSSWDEFSYTSDGEEYRMNEIAGAWCGNNRIIVLQRDDDRGFGHPFVQAESYDNGKTWTKPEQTNIPPNLHWGAAPEIIYDKDRDLLIAMGSDRYSRPNEQNSLFIYTAEPDDVFGNPKGWTLQHEILRPNAKLGIDCERPVNGQFYGYPTITPINKNEYLVVFTERAVMDGSEQADLYYFRMIIN
jgi:hypothetical protein